MKKIMTILVTMTVLTFSGIQYATAQGSVSVSWEDTENCACPYIGNWVYQVDIEIFDQCHGGSVSIYHDDMTTDESPAEFDLTGFDCLDHTLDPCYLVVGLVKKMCPDGQGGFIVVCTGRDQAYRSCNDLLYYPTYLNCGDLQ